MVTQTQKDTHTIYLGMGTNTGSRMENLLAAIDALSPEVQVVRRSPIYQTPPWGYTDQPDFLNLVLEATTSLPPQPLLEHLKNVEARIGRTANFRWGPREIDIDILFYGQLVSDEAGLEIPHPRLHERAFVLVPLADLTTDLIHPKNHKTVAELLTEIDTQGITPYTPDDPLPED